MSKPTCENHLLVCVGTLNKQRINAPACSQTATHETGHGAGLGGIIKLCGAHARGIDHFRIGGVKRHWRRIASVSIALPWIIIAGCGFAPNATDLDAGALGDGGATHADASDAGTISIDAANVIPPDAAPVLVTLRQTATDTPVNGHSDECLADAGTITHAETYARVWTLAQAFHVAQIDFSSTTTNATSVVVKVGTFTGSLGSGVLAASGITWIATSAPFDPTDGQHMNYIDVAGADVASGAQMIIAVASPDYTSGATFEIDGTSGAETGPSYWQATGCSTSELAQHDGRDNADVGTFIIDAIGWNL